MRHPMSKRKCYRCRMPAPKPEHLYERGDGRRYCQPCIVLLTYDAEVAEANRALDAAMTEHLRHDRLGRFAGCPICAVEV